MFATNSSTDAQPPTDDTGLYSFMDISVLVLRGRLIEFSCRQAAQTGKEKSSRRFGKTPLVAMA